jgi:hypothetical protein
MVRGLIEHKAICTKAQILMVNMNGRLLVATFSGLCYLPLLDYWIISQRFSTAQVVKRKMVSCCERLI